MLTSFRSGWMNDQDREAVRNTMIMAVWMAFIVGAMLTSFILRSPVLAGIVTIVGFVGVYSIASTSLK